jgi:beta-lactamase class A
MNRLSRRGLLLGGGALVALAACSAEPKTQPKSKPTLIDPAEPVSPIHDRIETLQGRHGAKIGVYGVDLMSGRSITYLDGELFAMCSTFKGYAAARVLQMSEHGELKLGDPVRIDRADIVDNSPMTEPAVGRTLTLADLCQAALQHSDNTAGNLLLRTIGGPPAITAFARTIGDDKTRLDRWEIELNSAEPGDPRDTSTPHALGIGYRNLLTGDALAPASRGQLETWMRGTTTSSMRAGLQPGWTTADKTGSGAYGSTNDVGIAYGPDGRRVLLSIMTRSESHDPGADGLRPLIGELTTLAVPWLINPD